MNSRGAQVELAYEDAESPPESLRAPGKQSLARSRPRTPQERFQTEVTHLRAHAGGIRERFVPALQADRNADGVASKLRWAAMQLHLGLARARDLANEAGDDAGRALADVETEVAAARELAAPFLDPSPAPVQRRATTPDVPEDVHAHAQAGVAGSGAPLPHLDAIQHSFGAHDVTGIQSHVGHGAAEAAAAIGAEAYATGNHVAFAEQPSLFVAAHEAAHVVQQRAGVSLLGGVGAAGDVYELQADAVAERVVRGESAEQLLGPTASGEGGRAVQHKAKPEAQPPTIHASPSKTSLVVGGSFEQTFVATSAAEDWEVNPKFETPAEHRIEVMQPHVRRHGREWTATVVAKAPGQTVLEARAAGGALSAAAAIVVTPERDHQALAAEALATTRRQLEMLRDAHLPALRTAISGRAFQDAQGASGQIETAQARAESEAKVARAHALQIFEEPARTLLLFQLDALDAQLAASRVEVDQALALAPSTASSSGDEDGDPLELAIAQEQQWNQTLDTEEALRWIDARPTPVRDDACAVDAAHAAHAFVGIDLYLRVKDKLRGLTSASASPDTVGPGEAGPYRLDPQLDGDELVYYLAFHRERGQHEWVVGPDSIDEFAAHVQLYVGAASTLLPGSVNVAGSQADGADEVRDPETVVEQEAFGRAPWQKAVDYLTDPDHLNGGLGAMVGARNARIRVDDYVKPARQLAEQLAADVASGKVDHLEARAQAVDGRNAILDKSRERLSPAGKHVSKKIKKQGKSLAEMTRKKVRDNLEAYGAKPRRPTDLAATEATRALLDADSELWAKYSAALDAGENVMDAALRDLGESPAVSRSIIQSAGKSNPWFTRAAKYGGPVLNVLGVVAAADAIWDIYNDLEARNWHAAAGEFSGALGGLVGGEAGVIFLTSLIPAGTGVVLITSVIGSMLGSALGSYTGRGLVDLIGSGAALGSGGMGTSYAAAGGFAGVHGKDHPAGYSAAEQLCDAIYATEAELAKVGEAIVHASDRTELGALQKMRLDILDRRDQMGDLLTAINLGMFDGMLAPEEPAAEPERKARSEPDDLCRPLDNDCDRGEWS